MEIKSTFVFDALVTLQQKIFSYHTISYASETTSCGCSMYFLRQAQNRRNLHFSIISFAQGRSQTFYSGGAKRKPGGAKPIVKIFRCK